MKEVSSIPLGAFQFLITKRMLSVPRGREHCSQRTSVYVPRLCFGSHSLGDVRGMPTFNKLGSASKSTVPAVSVTLIVLSTDCCDRVKDRLNSLCRSFSVISTNSNELVDEVIMKVG